MAKLVVVQLVWAVGSIAWAQTPPSISPALLPPATADLDAPSSYVLGVGDQISVSIWGSPDVDGVYTIGADGTFSMALLGEIKADGLTRQQLEDAINHAATRQLRTSRASVKLLASHSKHIYFDGDGIGPGTMDLVKPIHLSEALSIYGCCKEFADKSQIQLIRGGEPLTLEEGGKKSQYFKYSEIMLSAKHPERNPVLQDGDHILVP
jgi:polysaccharide biosynthesis/export protein